MSTKQRWLKIPAMAVLMVLMLSALAAPSAHAWWDAKWQQRMKIQFNTTTEGANLKENLSDVPVLVRLHAGNFSFSSSKADGSDLRFVGNDDKAPLKYHIEKFEPSEEIALIWVKVPRISGNSSQDFIWMYYGNSSASDAQDVGGTYDVNQVAVYHLGEKDGLPKDSTAYANIAAKFTARLGVPCAIGNGAQFGAGDGKMTIVESPSLNFNKGFSFSAWVRLAAPVKEGHIFSWGNGEQYLIIGMDGTKPFCKLSSAKGQTFETPETLQCTPGQWHHLAVTIDPNNRIMMFFDGNEVVTSRIKAAVPAPNADIFIGNSARGGNAFTGDIDEIQLSNTARTGEWMKAAFHGQGPDGKLNVYLEGEEGKGSEGSLTIHLMKVIIRTITLDGWMIIGVLFVMGCWSFVVFVEKIVTIRKHKKNNDAFNTEFRKTDQPMILTDRGEEFENSSLFAVYAAGADEVKLWSERKSGQSFREGKGLTGAAMNAFKAVLEKAAMLQTRRYNKGMFILNMSVAGGPFLGLLGTVWGVMNTFASLAEAGEANLTAIAPGVASALACTLAGLLVAIPTLFASIYINGRVRDLSADINVFMDEFILRMEEDSGDKK